MPQALLIIDPQHDFTAQGGALYVPGAEKDMQRLDAFIAREEGALDAIFVTMDSHRVMHIAHPAFWTDDEGLHPAPFTVITLSDVRAGRWRSLLNNALAENYLRLLEERGKKHTIWPPHCIVGTEGYALSSSLQQTLIHYAANIGQVHIIHKGDCLFAEHFSALRAEVESDLFPETKLNTPLLDALSAYDRVFLAGECADICVRETLRDFCSYAPTVASHLAILKDCMSPLDSSFNFNTDEVYQAAVALGAELITSE